MWQRRRAARLAACRRIPMTVYTVHEPPRRSDDPLAHAERFIFVRDGFSFIAFLLTPLWMLRHRLWLALICYLGLLIALTAALRLVGISGGAIASAMLLL